MYFSLDYLKQYLNATKHVGKEAAHQSSEELISIQETNPFQPIVPHGSLTLIPDTCA